jgi:hypothetical protein
MKSWMIYSRCYFYICPKKKYFETLMLEEGGVVHLANDEACLLG